MRPDGPGGSRVSESLARCRGGIHWPAASRRSLKHWKPGEALQSRGRPGRSGISPSHGRAEPHQICDVGVSWSRWFTVPTRMPISFVSAPSPVVQIGEPHSGQKNCRLRLPLSATLTEQRGAAPVSRNASRGDRGGPAKGAAGQLLAVGAMADRYPPRGDLCLVGDMAAMAAPVDFHPCARLFVVASLAFLPLAPGDGNLDRLETGPAWRGWSKAPMSPVAAPPRPRQRRQGSAPGPAAWPCAAHMSRR